MSKDDVMLEDCHVLLDIESHLLTFFILFFLCCRISVCSKLTCLSCINLCCVGFTIRVNPLGERERES